MQKIRVVLLHVETLSRIRRHEVLRDRVELFFRRRLRTIRPFVITTAQPALAQLVRRSEIVKDDTHLLGIAERSQPRTLLRYVAAEIEDDRHAVAENALDVWRRSEERRVGKEG